MGMSRLEVHGEDSLNIVDRDKTEPNIGAVGIPGDSNTTPITYPL